MRQLNECVPSEVDRTRLDHTIAGRERSDHTPCRSLPRALIRKTLCLLKHQLDRLLLLIRRVLVTPQRDPNEVAQSEAPPSEVACFTPDLPTLLHPAGWKPADRPPGRRRSEAADGPSADRPAGGRRSGAAPLRARGRGAPANGAPPSRRRSVRSHLKVMVSRRPVVPPAAHAALLETGGWSRRGRGRCGRAFRAALCRRGRSAGRA